MNFMVQMFLLPLIFYREVSGLRMNNFNLGESEPDIKPIYYVHIPKAGSSFATAIAHLACGSTIDKNATVMLPIGKTEQWQQRCGAENIARFESDHQPLEDGIDLRTVVTMVRPSKQRIISGYMHNLHDCPKLQRKLHINEYTPPWNPKQVDRKLLMEYGNCVQGCASTMLNGHWCRKEERSLEHLQADANQAVAKIPQMGFVGLTNHWDLTVCMWHAKYGGECLEAEFSNLRPGDYGSAQHDEKTFDKSFHPIDDAIYDAAAQQFISDMKKYDVSPKTCAEKYCKNMAHLFQKGEKIHFNFKDEAIDHDSFTRDHLDALTWEGRRNFYED